ncbi:Acg family FMN-binding oxidoreductase [Pseudonocardia abyssalis]|uniref:NAD(P)H nitroreductase n=1 Tax=Pseudonocardia abyssalis TaxID=2792008 RepID=A0ABS6UNL1_9PSEU|nr:NAD(P)H nitroreductase [Pseudonocardia abyssalis]MBW0117469.1 NAD(P)H nitroreductase [Pseudonocardia abyssalis]MBW0133541.1 NAD(P)H nitroreductase [Pseudonocardia abyssalis]
MPTVPSDVAVLRRAVEYAIHAPSVHNSQPWRWRIGPEGVDLFADPDRRLPATDPEGRDLLLSCGAGLHHLLVALAGLGFSARVDRFPDPQDSDHLAHVRPTDAVPAPGAVRLAGAIPRRHTDRRRFAARHVDQAVLDALVRAAAGWGAHLHVVGPGNARRQLLEMLTRSATLQRQQAGYAAELAMWTGRYTGSGDGIRADAVAVAGGRAGDVPMRPFPRSGLVQPPHSIEHVDASVLMVLSAATADAVGTLRAGEATSAVLLTATDLGLATTPLSQPLEVASTRAAISRNIVGPQRFPQIVLRVGWAHADSANLVSTARRALDHVLRTG